MARRKPPNKTPERTVRAAERLIRQGHNDPEVLRRLRDRGHNTSESKVGDIRRGMGIKGRQERENQARRELLKSMVMGGASPQEIISAMKNRGWDPGPRYQQKIGSMVRRRVVDEFFPHASETARRLLTRKKRPVRHLAVMARLFSLGIPDEEVARKLAKRGIYLDNDKVRLLREDFVQHGLVNRESAHQTPETVSEPPKRVRDIMRRFRSLSPRERWERYRRLQEEKRGLEESIRGNSQPPDATERIAGIHDRLWALTEVDPDIRRVDWKGMLAAGTETPKRTERLARLFRGD